LVFRSAFADGAARTPGRVVCYIRKDLERQADRPARRRHGDARHMTRRMA